ncbi:cytidylyltransferase domain-containing protein [Atopobacter phocae]|uniref:cytidylyltransferase domain-containing protein n=1 Tax=Atopobacter phocae TaxID=136492 RepID=UPI00046F56AF|nr:DapH/DapD/GlmU-related protein [Atopobacter phocae]
MKKKQHAIILANHKEDQMKSELSVYQHLICGRPMIDYALETVERVGMNQVIVATDLANQEWARDLNESASHVSVMDVTNAQTMNDSFSDQEGITLILQGNMPMIQSTTLRELVKLHQQSDAKATVLMDQPVSVGNHLQVVSPIQSNEQRANQIAEQTATERQTVVYCLDNDIWMNKASMFRDINDVEALVQSLDTNNVQEIQTTHPFEGTKINTRIDLAHVTQLIQKQINTEHMLNGVTMIHPETAAIEWGVTIGTDTVIESHVTLKGKTSIGTNCVITQGSRIEDSQIGDRVIIKQSVVEESLVESDSDMGPFAHLRPNSRIGTHVHLGNFVEIKNSSIGEGTKVGHLTYVGDAQLGRFINIGSGTNFVNYNGKTKAQTTIGDHAFIGCDTSLVAPVNVGKGSFTAAGSVITEDVPDNSLAIARNRQINKINYANGMPHNQ